MTQAFLLALDAALGPGSVAIARGGEVVVFREITEREQQAAQLVPLMEAALQEARITYHNLDKIVCSVGPGSFTGIRIGLATARGVGFATGKRVIGISSLAAAALATGRETAYLPAGKGECYTQRFHMENLSPLGDISLIPEADAPGRPLELPTARHYLTLAAEKYSHLHLAPEPLYIRPPDAKLPAV